jgi:hypothetical protein
VELALETSSGTFSTPAGASATGTTGTTPPLGNSSADRYRQLVDRAVGADVVADAADAVVQAGQDFSGWTQRLVWPDAPYRDVYPVLRCESVEMM